MRHDVDTGDTGGAGDADGSTSGGPLNRSSNGTAHHIATPGGGIRAARGTGFDTIVIGGGVIGLVTAWRAAQRGMSVAVVDPVRPGSASAVSAGMLTPVSELTYGEEALLRLGLASRARYPAFVAELEEASGLDTGYRKDGILEVAFDADDLAVLDDLRLFQESLGVPGEALDARQCRELEPMLAPGVRGGLLARDDGAIDPRRLTAALLVAFERLGGTMVAERVTEVIVEGDAAAGVRLGRAGELRADRVVLAAGCWSGEVGGLPAGALPPVRPVKGQILRLRAPGRFLKRCTRGVVRGSPVYVLPREDGEVVVGATQEELGFDTTITAGGVYQLLRDARELLPGITELELVEAAAGLRPGSPDNAPLLGPSAMPGLYLATGHFRNGVLLAAVTGDVMADALTAGRLPEVAALFAADRFDRLEKSIR